MRPRGDQFIFYNIGVPPFHKFVRISRKKHLIVTIGDLGEIDAWNSETGEFIYRTNQIKENGLLVSAEFLDGLDQNLLLVNLHGFAVYDLSTKQALKTGTFRDEFSEIAAGEQLNIPRKAYFDLEHPRIQTAIKERKRERITGIPTVIGFSQNRKYIGLVWSHKIFYLWEFASKIPRAYFSIPSVDIDSIAISDDGNRVAIGLTGELIILFANKGEAFQLIAEKQTKAVHSLQFLKKDSLLVGIHRNSRNPVLNLWAIPDFEVLRRIDLSINEISELYRVSLDRQYLMYMLDEKTLEILDLETMTPKYSELSSNAIKSFDFNDKTKNLVFLSQAGRYSLHKKNIESGENIFSLLARNRLLNVQKSQSVDHLVSMVDIEGKLYQYNYKINQYLSTTYRTDEKPKKAYISPFDDHIISIFEEYDQRIGLRYAEMIYEVMIIEKHTGHEPPVMLTNNDEWTASLAVDPENSWLFTGHQTRRIKISRLSDGNLGRIISNKITGVPAFLFPFQDKLIVGIEEGRINIYHLPSCKYWRGWQVGTGINAMEIDPSERFVALSSERYSISLWRIETGELVWGRTTNIGEVNAITFSKDSEFVFASSSSPVNHLQERNGGSPIRMRCWQTSNGYQLLRFRGELYPIEKIIFEPEELLLITIDLIGNIYCRSFPKHRAEALREIYRKFILQFSGPEKI